MSIHLFILASHNSGSTALWEILKTSPNVTCLPGEGQHIPEVQALMRTAPWNPDFAIPWEEVRQAWEKYWSPAKTIRVEKSPPNLVRAAAIEANFDDARFIVMVRDPYAYCEGVKRRGRNGIGYPRNASYAQIAQGWVEEGRIQEKNLQLLRRTLLLTFEAFTDDPEAAACEIINFLPELEMLKPDASFTVHSLHGHVERPITNLNQHQIARLTGEDIKEINSVLSKNQQILEAFGYSLLESPPAAWATARMTLTNLYHKFGVRNYQRLVRWLKRHVHTRPAK